MVGKFKCLKLFIVTLLILTLLAVMPLISCSNSDAEGQPQPSLLQSINNRVLLVEKALGTMASYQKKTSTELSGIKAELVEIKKQLKEINGKLR